MPAICSLINFLIILCRFYCAFIHQELPGNLKVILILDADCIAKMELAKETNYEAEVVQEDTEAMENGAFDHSGEPNTTFLVELNLLIMVLSLFSLSSEDCLNCAEKEMASFKDHELTANISRLQTRRQEMKEVKPAGRRAQRFLPMIKDSRYVLILVSQRFYRLKEKILTFSFVMFFLIRHWQKR